MALVLEQINVEGLAHLSYLVGDDKAGVVAVIDPRRDVAIYLQPGCWTSELTGQRY